MKVAHKIVFVAVGVLFSVAPLCVARAQASPRGNSSATSGKVGSHVPDFCLNDLAGRPVCSSEFRGKVLLLDFWASWCGPCKKEMPAYEKFEEEYASRGFAVVGIGISMDSPTNLKRFARKLGVHYTLLMGTMPVQDKFGLKGIPTTILVDRTGVIRKVVVGFDYPNKFEPAIRRLLGEAR